MKLALLRVYALMLLTSVCFTAYLLLLLLLSHFSRVQLYATPRTAATQVPPSVGFSRQEYWSGVPLPSPYLLLHFLYVCHFVDDFTL